MAKTFLQQVQEILGAPEHIVRTEEETLELLRMWKEKLDGYEDREEAQRRGR